MSRIDDRFAALRKRGEGALVPFLTAGDPDMAQSRERIFAACEAGLDVLELGLPFSDPAADGPTIQAAAERALASGVTPPICFELLAKIRQKHPNCYLKKKKKNVCNFFTIKCISKR